MVSAMTAKEFPGSAEAAAPPRDAPGRIELTSDELAEVAGGVDCSWLESDAEDDDLLERL
jgi:hypothetical protein